MTDSLRFLLRSAHVAALLPACLLLTGIAQCGETDADGDGWTTEDGDCDDGNGNIHPGADEVLGNEADDDCDGQIDEGGPAASCADAPQIEAGTYQFELSGSGTAWVSFDASSDTVLYFAAQAEAADLDLVLYDDDCVTALAGVSTAEDLESLSYTTSSYGSLKLGIVFASGDPAASYTLELSEIATFGIDYVSTTTLLDDVTGNDLHATYTGSISSLVSTSGTVTDLTGYVTALNGTEPLSYASITFDDSHFYLDIDLSYLDFTETNPLNVEVHVQLAIDGDGYDLAFYWTLVALPERTGLMWVGDTLYAKLNPYVVFRSSGALYFDSYTVTYDPESYLTDTVVRMKTSSTGGEPSASSILLAYYTTGVYSVTSSNEAHFYTFSKAYTGDGYEAYLAESAVDGYFYFIEPDDYNGDGEIDYLDLDAVDLDALYPY